MRRTVRLHLILLPVLVGSLASLPAQVFTPSNSGATTTPASPGSPSSGGTSSQGTNSGGQNGNNNNVMGNVLPMFDPSTETVLFEGQMWDINDNRVLNARFEKYLNAPPAESAPDKEYRAILEKMRQDLSPHNKAKGGRTDIQSAVAGLERAALYDQDGRISESIANAVYRIWLARRETNNLQLANERLRQNRKDMARNAQIAGEGSKLQAPPQQSGGRNNSNNNNNSGGNNNQNGSTGAQATATISEVSEYVTRYTEIQAKITANEAKVAISDVQSKLEFQSLLVQLFMQRRFEHVVIGARLYTEFYSDGAGKIEFKEGSDAEKMFKDTAGFDPTVTTLDSLATEAIRDTQEAVKSFDFLIEKNERASASKRLMEAFMIGEFLPPIQTVSLEKKQSIKDFVQNYNKLLSALEVRDYESAEASVTSLRGLAGDFDHTKPMAAINTAKVASSMHIKKAVNESMKGNEAAYEQSMKAAAEIWPTNPEFKKALEMTMGHGNLMLQAVNDFDQLVATQSHRQIFNDKERFGASLYTDPERAAKLSKIVNDIGKIDVTIAQSEVLARRGDRYGAWEQVERVFKDFSDDPPLTKVRSDLTTEVADFVSCLKKAEQLEARKQYGASLAWYLKSRQMYPMSTYAKEGIDRMVGEVLPDGGGVSGTPGNGATNPLPEPEPSL